MSLAGTLRRNQRTEPLGSAVPRGPAGASPRQRGAATSAVTNPAGEGKVGSCQPETEMLEEQAP